jgi:Spy/CpxP family protein refolding chaperone
MRRFLSLVVLVALVASPFSLKAQRGGGGGAGMPMGGAANRTRLQVLTDAFTLDKDQKTKVKTIMDDAYKSAAPQRAALTQTRAALGTALAAGKPDGEVATATKAYSDAAAAMTALEMKTLSQILASLPQAQKDAGLNEAFYMMRGALADKKWDQTPDSITY